MRMSLTAESPLWCPASAASMPSPASGPDRHCLAAIGIISHEGREAHRAASRSSWLSLLPGLPDMHVRFAIRGVGLNDPSRLHEEARTHGDVLLLRERSNLTLQEAAPLRSLLLWYRCAQHLFPDAAYVGKMDDDAWLQPVGMRELLLTILPWRQAYVGSFESFHWDEAASVPRAPWYGAPSVKACRLTSSGLAGPFSFAKGAAFFLTADLVALLSPPRRNRRDFFSGDAGAQGDGDPRCLPGSRSLWPSMRPVGATGVEAGARLVAPGAPAGGEAPAHGEAPSIEPAPACAGRTSERGAAAGGGAAARGTSKPWEDVWVGYALSRMAAASRTAVIHMPASLYHEPVSRPRHLNALVGPGSPPLLTGPVSLLGPRPPPARPAVRRRGVSARSARHSSGTRAPTRASPHASARWTVGQAPNSAAVRTQSHAGEVTAGGTSRSARAPAATLPFSCVAWGDWPSSLTTQLAVRAGACHRAKLC